MVPLTSVTNTFSAWLDVVVALYYEVYLRNYPDSMLVCSPPFWGGVAHPAFTYRSIVRLLVVRVDTTGID